LVAAQLHCVLGRARAPATTGRPSGGRSGLRSTPTDLDGLQYFVHTQYYCVACPVLPGPVLCQVVWQLPPMLCRGGSLLPDWISSAVGAASNCLAIKLHLAPRLSATLGIALLLSGIYCPVTMWCDARPDPPSPSPSRSVSVSLFDASQNQEPWKKNFLAPPARPRRCRPMGALERQRQSTGQDVASRKPGLGCSG
jgi:hypothetical protein